MIYPGIRPDMVAIPLGQGHTGQWSLCQRQRGKSPGLVGAREKGVIIMPAWNATRVRVTRISNKGDLVTAGHPEGSYRSELIEI